MSVIKRRRVYRWMWAGRSRSRWRSRVAPESLFTVVFGAGEPLRRPGPRLVRAAAAPEEIMTCRCSAARAKLLFSFLFLYDYAATLPRRPTTLLRTEPVGVSSPFVCLLFWTKFLFVSFLWSFARPAFCPFPDLSFPSHTPARQPHMINYPKPSRDTGPLTWCNLCFSPPAVKIPCTT